MWLNPLCIVRLGNHQKYVDSSFEDCACEVDYILTMYAELAQDELAQVGQTAQEWLV